MDVFQKSLHLCALDESSLSIERGKAYLVGTGLAEGGGGLHKVLDLPPGWGLALLYWPLLEVLRHGGLPRKGGVCRTVVTGWSEGFLPLVARVGLVVGLNRSHTHERGCHRLISITPLSDCKEKSENVSISLCILG